MKNQHIPCCDITVIHQEVIEHVRQNMPKEKELITLARFFKNFGDPTRIKILYALFQSEMCVCDIAHLLGMTQSAISHQLRVLKQAQLVKFRKEGRVVYYSLDDDHVKTIFDQGYQHIRERT